jgi:hypothetical protein
MKLRQTLFWDTDPQKIDLNKNKRYVIERVINYGTLAEWKWLSSVYTKKDISEGLKAKGKFQRSNIRKSAARLASLILIK